MAAYGGSRKFYEKQYLLSEMIEPNSLVCKIELLHERVCLICFYIFDFVINFVLRYYTYIV